MRARAVGAARGALVVVWLALVGACGGHLQAFPRALGDWQAGRRAAAIEAARDEVERWREGNDLAADDVARALADLDRVFADDVPLVVPGDVAPDAAGAAGVDLDAAIRRDLLSNRATVVVRALRSVGGLGLDRHGAAVLTVVFRREPVEADGGLLASASPAMRSVVTKRLALRALEQLAAARRPVL